jgi:hypothetical protein
MLSNLGQPEQTHARSRARLDPFAEQQLACEQDRGQGVAGPSSAVTSAIFRSIVAPL